MTVSPRRRGRILPAAAIILAGAAGAAESQEAASGLPFNAIQNGDVQPRHSSPIRAFEAVKGPGLDGPSPAGRGVAPVAPFLPRLRQHRDSRPSPIQPLFGADRAPGDLPYRNDHVRVPAGEVEDLRQSARSTKLATGYSSPGDTIDVYGQSTVRTPDMYVRGFIRGVDAGSSFQDGDGNTTPFSYERNTQQVILGWTPAPGVEVFGVGIRDDIAEDRTPSAGLDNAVTERWVGRLGGEFSNVNGPIDRIRADVRLRDGSRTNDNFTVRAFRFQPGSRRVEVDNDRRILDGRLFGDTSLGGIEHRFGIDWSYEQREGERAADSRPPSPIPLLDLHAATLFPDVEILEIGPTWEAAASASPDDHFRLGLGYRFVDAGASDSAINRQGEGPFAFLTPGLPATPSNAYLHYYGTSETGSRDHLLSARLVYQREALNDRLTLFGELARTDRAPDSKERYFAATTPPPQAANRLIGNPALDPERHYTLGGGLDLSGPDWVGFGRARRGPTTILLGAWRLRGAARVSWIDDFISRDKARGQNGILRNDQALVFRNVDARFVTGEIDAEWNLTPRLATRLNLVATFARNTSEDRALYGIAPMEANWLVEYRDSLGTVGTWSVGAKLRLAARQDRVDDDPATGSGFDEGETDGFAVVDLYAGAQVFDRAGLRLGVENLLDVDYREHAARDTLEFPTRRRIDAPGRTVFVRGIVTF